uniref:Uncharacterized protein n=1 Tax=Arundo donax TaxID=35708 RepID=A0A0A9GJL8_ARUDO
MNRPPSLLLLILHKGMFRSSQKNSRFMDSRYDR